MFTLISGSVLGRYGRFGETRYLHILCLSQSKLGTSSFNRDEGTSIFLSSVGINTRHCVSVSDAVTLQFVLVSFSLIFIIYSVILNLEIESCHASKQTTGHWRIWHSEDRASWYILIIKPTRCINFSNLFLEKNSTCFGQVFSPSSGVYYCIHSNRYMSYRLCWLLTSRIKMYYILIPLASSQHTLYDIYLLLCTQY
jgi:hypothetical protein